MVNMNKDLSVADQVLNNKESGKWITTLADAKRGNRTDNSDNDSRGRGQPETRGILKNHR